MIDNEYFLTKFKNIDKKPNGNTIISHDILNFSLVMSQEELSKIDQYCKPHKLERYSSFIDDLIKTKFLVSLSTEEEFENLLFDKWIKIFEKDIHTFSYNGKDILLIYCCSKQDSINEILFEICKILYDISKEYIFLRPIRLCLFNNKEFAYIKKLYSLSECVFAFVDSKSIMVLNYEAFFDSSRSSLFYPTIRHETMHILLGQYNMTLPFWVEEGLCEIFSHKYNINMLNKALQKNKIAFSFKDYEKNNIEYILYDEKALALEGYFYNIVQSFLNFLLSELGMSKFKNILYNTSIINSFSSLIYKETNITIGEYEDKWLKYLEEFI